MIEILSYKKKRFVTYEELENYGSEVVLKEDIEVDDLENVFRGYLALDVLLAFVDKRCVIQLGVGVC